MGKNYFERRGAFTDDDLVECYLRYHSQIKAAEELGCSRETVARAVRRSGIKLTGRDFNSGKQTSKISDDELKEDSKTLNAIEIAKKHGMSVEQIFRRAKGLGLELIPVEYGRWWYARAKRYGTREYDNTITLERLIERDNGICKICGKPVDKNDIEKGHIRKNYPTLDHIVPLSKGGTHTWNNIQLAHMRCNAGKCDRITV